MKDLIGLLGAHSIKKFGATRVQHCGELQEMIMTFAEDGNNKREVHVYTQRENNCSLFLQKSVFENYTRLHNKELSTNPVERIALMAHGSDTEVFLDEIIVVRDPIDPQAGNRVPLNDEAHSYIAGMSERSATDWLRGIQSQLSSLKASVLSLEEKMLTNDAVVKWKLTSIQ